MNEDKGIAAKHYTCSLRAGSIEKSLSQSFMQLKKKVQRGFKSCNKRLCKQPGERARGK